MAESERDQVISMLRACLLSTKGGIPLSNLERDYKMIVGSRIPYQKLGFQTLDKFLKSIPNVSISQDRNGQMILDAIPTKNSEHLAALVSKQRSAPKKPTRSLPPRRTAASSWRPPPSAMSTKPPRRPVSSRVPLSVTVSNRFDGNKGLTFEKTSRIVLFSNSTTSTSSSTTHSSSGRSSYEKPPRFLKLEQQGNIASAQVSGKPIHTAAPTSVPSVPTVPANSSSSQSMSKAQERLQQVVASIKNKNIAMAATNESVVTNKSSEVPAGGCTITSPLTPLHARLNAVVRKSHVPVLKPIEKKFVAAASLGGGEDFIKILEDFAQSKGMSKPTFKVMPRISEGKTVYSCSVKIDDFRISSYPDERTLPAEAMQLAAKRAFDELNKITSAIGGSATQDENIIMSRISDIVSKHRYGIWSMQIPIDYNKKYSETLPDNWLKIMSRCPIVTFEHVAENRIILIPNWPAPPSEPTSPTASAINPMDVLQEKFSLSVIGPAIPDQIALPKDDVWDVYITCGNSTDEIWARLIGEEYSMKYENLATDMEMFYMGASNVVSNPEVGMFYAVKMDDCWYRVKVIEINEAGTEAQVFFIDHGDEELVELKELHVLERRFARLPAQAVLCYLCGLEDFVDDPNAAHHITDTIIGKTLIASVKSRPSYENRAVGIIIYDTSTDEDLNMNTILLESISKDAMAPQLPSEGKVEEVYISHVTDTGDIFLQFDSYNYLQTLVSNVIETSLKEADLMKGTNNNLPDPNRLYLARYHLDGNWYRAAITKGIDANMVEVIFVDFGNTEMIKQADLILLDTVKKSIADFPHQAIKVHLQNVPPSSFSEHLAQRVRELVPCDERVLIKTISFGRSTNTVPVVNIFKRIQPDNLLVSINETLTYEIDVKPSDDIRGKKRLERLHSLTSTSDGPVSNILHSPTGSDSQSDTTSLRGLRPPQIPEIGEYFDVHVTMAANPGNFTVQPYKDSKQLEEMMEEMQAHYKERKYPQPMTENVHEGGLFAALHNDDYWYRVCVSNVIVGNMISVYFCDYGDVSVLTVDKLQPLISQFKEMPYQAIKAKLAGIQAKHSDWSVEDCLMFQELVVEHQFVSIIKETGPDLLNPSDMVLGLTLIDTSGEEDVYIDQLLIVQERAILTPTS